MESILLIAVTGTLNAVCFFIGAKIGQKVAKDEPIEMPNVNPMKMYQEHIDKREADKEKKRIETILTNIDNYDGTGLGQKDVL